MLDSLAMGRPLALALSSVLLAAGPATAQMEIDDLIVTAGPASFDGIFTDYFVDAVVFGFEIASVDVSTGSGENITLVEVLEDEFICDDVVGEPCEDFTSLAEINAIGDLTFTFAGESGEVDTIVVAAADWIPGAGQVGTPSITAPGPGSAALPPGNTFMWSPAPAWVELIQVDLVDLVLDDGVDEMLFTNPAVTSWTATGVNPARVYGFELSFVDAFFVEDLRTSQQGRPYFFTSGYQAFDTKAVPEPTGLAVWGTSLMAFGALARRRARA